MYLSNIVIDTHLNWTLSAMLRVFYILIFILLVRKVMMKDEKVCIQH